MKSANHPFLGDIYVFSFDRYDVFGIDWNNEFIHPQMNMTYFQQLFYNAIYNVGKSQFLHK